VVEAEVAEAAREVALAVEPAVGPEAAVADLTE
jgi:hypothetical protein